MQLKVTIPVNTTAEIFVPSTGTGLIVDGKKLSVNENGLSVGGKGRSVDVKKLSNDEKELPVGGKGLPVDGKERSIYGKNAETLEIADAPGTGYHYLKLTKGSGTYLLEAEFKNDL